MAVKGGRGGREEVEKRGKTGVRKDRNRWGEERIVRKEVRHINY